MAFPIRGVPPDVVEKLDRAAASKGLSRNAYLVEVLAEHARRVRPTVTAESFAEAADLAVDLGDEGVMGAAWS
ncbi:MAG: type II toxin-antitoxin system VapB family antitoxin [Acidimicrobiales bacterium]